MLVSLKTETFSLVTVIVFVLLSISSVEKSDLGCVWRSRVLFCVCV